MQTSESFAASSRPSGQLSSSFVENGQRLMRICNACRYCEGFCAVFPALERRLDFTERDITYLANLCHNCGSCYYACQYAPPHEFDLDFPRLLAQWRLASYQKYAWPAVFGRFFRRGGAVAALLTALCLIAVLLGAAWLASPSTLFSAHSLESGNFYRVIPHSVMTWCFGIVFSFALLALAMGLHRFWRDSGEKATNFLDPPSLLSALRDVLVLRYLDGGGEGCTYPNDRPSKLRRIFHHFTMYGFLLCFAATTAGVIYHYLLNWPAPYSLNSLPVVLGTLGGIGLLIGPLGLLWLKTRRDPMLVDTAQDGMDVGFLLLLLLAAVSGLALLLWRETTAMGSLLAIHLGFVLALFLSMPYGKFVHGLYRFAALVRYALEQRRPPPIVAPD